jgi:hypothetical protein
VCHQLLVVGNSHFLLLCLCLWVRSDEHVIFLWAPMVVLINYRLVTLFFFTLKNQFRNLVNPPRQLIRSSCDVELLWCEVCFIQHKAMKIYLALRKYLTA